MKKINSFYEIPKLIHDKDFMELGKGIFGAIIGDIVGSIYEFDNIKTKDFKLFSYDCYFTDDTVMSIAIYKSLNDCKGDYTNLSEITIQNMQTIGRKYPGAGYGGRFHGWIYNDDPKPYYSFGNGAAMRISAVAYFANSIEEVKELSRKVTEVTHNHPEGLKGAEATAIAIYLAKEGKSIEDIRKHINDNYYKLDFTLDEIRPFYKFNETCQNTVPQAIEAFLESTSFEDAIRNAISIGGDSDTLAAITGSIAEAYYGIPRNIKEEALTFLDERLLNIMIECYNRSSKYINRSK